MENLERKFLEKLGSMEKTIHILQEKTEMNDKDLLVKVVQLESKLENFQEMTNQQTIQSNSKYQSVERVLKEQEVQLKETMEKYQQAVSALSN